MNRVLVVGLAVLMLAGCAVDAPSKEHDPSAPATKDVVGKVESRTPIPEPTATLSSPPTTVEAPVETAVLEIMCHSDDFATKEIVSSLKEAWQSDLECDEAVFPLGGDVETIEEWEAKTGINGLTLEDVEFNLSICADREYPWSFDVLTDPQREEADMAVKFCPEHPDMKKFKKAMKTSEAHILKEEAGERVVNGTYYVPEDAKPGVWRAEGKVEDCYWEVTAADGTIVANNFARAGSKVSFSVKSGQSFTLEGGCGPFSTD